MSDTQVQKHEDSRVETFDALDRVEQRILEVGGQVQGKGEVLDGFPVRHEFTPGLYIRQITMPAGAVLTSRIHKTEHPFIVSKGLCSVYIEGEGFVHIRAPHLGITKPGTRRLLVIHEETVWTTFHPTDTTDLVELDEELLEPMENPLIDAGEKNIEIGGGS